MASKISLTAAAQKGGSVKHKTQGSLLVFLNLTVDTNRCSGTKLEEKDNNEAQGGQPPATQLLGERRPDTSWKGRGIFPKSKGAQSTDVKNSSASLKTQEGRPHGDSRLWHYGETLS